MEAIRDTLEARYPHLPGGSTVVVDGVPLDAVGGSCAIRLWYPDSTLSMVPGALQEHRTPETAGGSVVLIDLGSASAPHPR